MKKVLFIVLLLASSPLWSDTFSVNVKVNYSNSTGGTTSTNESYTINASSPQEAERQALANVYSKYRVVNSASVSSIRNLTPAPAQGVPNAIQRLNQEQQQRADRQQTFAEQNQKQQDYINSQMAKINANSSSSPSPAKIRDLAHASNTQGVLYYNKGEYDKAIVETTEAIRLDPSYPYAYATRAAAYNAKRDYDKAIADANQGILIDPTLGSAYRERGFAYMQKGNFTQARADVNKALQFGPLDQKAKDLDAELKRMGY